MNFILIVPYRRPRQFMLKVTSSRHDLQTNTHTSSLEHCGITVCCTFRSETTDGNKCTPDIHSAVLAYTHTACAFMCHKVQGWCQGNMLRLAIWHARRCMRALAFRLRQSLCSISMSEHHWCQVLCYTISCTVMYSRICYQISRQYDLYKAYCRLHQNG